MIAGRAYGLRSHILDNNLKSALLLAGFPVLLLLVWFAMCLLGAAQSDAAATLALGFDYFAASWPLAILAAGLWFAIAFVAHQAIIDAATGARRVTRTEEPELYNLLENLCISRGIAMPSLRIMETDALNAYASGLSERTASIAVTRGLMGGLDKAELEAVLAHELTHIRNRDVRTMVIAVVFAGIISFVGEMTFRMLSHGQQPRVSRGRRDGGGGAAAVLLIALAIIAVSYLLAIVIRFLLSRTREYVADAGSVELTKNPDAMISALKKVAGRSTMVDAPAEAREMFFDNETSGFQRLFATHPAIEDRIKALIEFAGGVDADPLPHP